jgi:inner membrane protein YhjD
LLERITGSRVVRTARAVTDRYGQDAGEYLAASIAFYGFLSFFPLLLLALAIVGFAVAESPVLRSEIERALTRAVPGLEALVGRNLDALRDARAAAGLIGLAGLLWTGTGVVGASRNAVRLVFRQGPPMAGLARRAWLVAVTVGLGLLALTATVLATVAGGLESEGPIGVALRVGGALVAFALDLVLFVVAYRVLMRHRPAWGEVLPGAVLAAIGWTLLKVLGSWYATRTVEGSQTVYGTFAATVGVLVVLYLAARLFVYGAELNAVLLERKGGGPMETTDGERMRRDVADPRELSTPQLVTRMAGGVGTLVKKEAELARQEVTEGIAAKAKGAAAFGGAAVMGLFVLGFLGAAGAVALSLVVELWAALLIVAGVFLLLALVAALIGRSAMKKPVSPEQAKRTIKEDMEWAKAQLRR